MNQQEKKYSMSQFIAFLERCVERTKDPKYQAGEKEADEKIISKLGPLVYKWMAIHFGMKGQDTAIQGLIEMAKSGELEKSPEFLDGAEFAEAAEETIRKAMGGGK